MTSVIFIMQGTLLSSWEYFDMSTEARNALLGRQSLVKRHRLCNPPFDDKYHGTYMIKEIWPPIDKGDNLRTYINTLTPEQLKELKI